jgi:hypothetical protein
LRENARSDRIQLLLSVRFDVGFGGLLGMVCGVKMVAMREVCMVSRRLMMTRLVVLGGLQMVMVSVPVVLGRFAMMFRRLF